MTKLADDVVFGCDRKGQMNLDDSSAGACDVRFDGFFNRAVSIVKHDDGVSFIEPSFVESPCGLLEDDSGGGGGVIDDGDFVDVVCVDEFFDDGSGMEDSFFEVVEVEVIWLTKEFELPFTLGGEDGGWTATEGAVVETRDGGVMVGEFRLDFGVGDLRGMEFGFL